MAPCTWAWGGGRTNQDKLKTLFAFSGLTCGGATPYLRYLSEGVRLWDSLVAVDAVALNGERALWRRVALRHVGWGGC